MCDVCMLSQALVAPLLSHALLDLTHVTSARLFSAQVGLNSPLGQDALVFFQ